MRARRDLESWVLLGLWMVWAFPAKFCGILARLTSALTRQDMIRDLPDTSTAELVVWSP